MKIKKYIYMPIIFAIYLGVMAYFGKNNDNISTGEYFAVLGVGALVIVFLYFTLRRKDKLKDNNQDLDK